MLPESITANIFGSWVIQCITFHFYQTFGNTLVGIHVQVYKGQDQIRCFFELADAVLVNEVEKQFVKQKPAQTQLFMK